MKNIKINAGTAKRLSKAADFILIDASLFSCYEKATVPLG